jgi:hypothetical protein
VHCGRSGHGFGGIYYSFAENARENTANGGFNVEADEYELFLKSMMNLAHNERRMSAEAAAEVLWSELIEQAGITHD